MFSPIETLMMVAIPFLAWLSAYIACGVFFQRPWIANVLVVALILLSGAVALLDGSRRRRSARDVANELRQMQTLYPSCHVTRLKNGNWFLTDRSTEREYTGPQRSH
jgi:hypothetical protein